MTNSKEYMQQWRKNNPEKIRASQLKRNAKKIEERRLAKLNAPPKPPKEVDPVLKKEKDKIKFDKYHTTNKGRAAVLLNNARARAKKQNVKCEITTQWIIDKLKSGICEVTGLPFQIKTNGGKGHKENSFSPSIDRIDQSGDYTMDNCRMTCWIFNRARGAFPDKDFDLMIESLKNS
jgi:hypothetical protein